MQMYKFNFLRKSKLKNVYRYFWSILASSLSSSMSIYEMLKEYVSVEQPT